MQITYKKNYELDINNFDVINIATFRFTYLTLLGYGGYIIAL